MGTARQTTVKVFDTIFLQNRSLEAETTLQMAFISNAPLRFSTTPTSKRYFITVTKFRKKIDGFSYQVRVKTYVGLPLLHLT